MLQPGEYDCVDRVLCRRTTTAVVETEGAVAAVWRKQRFPALDSEVWTLARHKFGSGKRESLERCKESARPATRKFKERLSNAKSTPIMAFPCVEQDRCCCLQVASLAVAPSCKTAEPLDGFLCSESAVVTPETCTAQG